MKRKSISLTLIAVLLLGVLTGCGKMGIDNAADREPSENYGNKNEAWYQQENPDNAGEFDVEDGRWYEDEEMQWFRSDVQPPVSGERYGSYQESPFKDTIANPLSTFSASPNTASYSNMRRFINRNSIPPSQGVRIEELVNYFSYDYPTPEPNSEHPFTITTEVTHCPWNPGNQLAMVGIQGESLADKERLRSNVVLLIDISGSMSGENKLPLVKKSFIAMLDRFTEDDIVSIVTYAGNSSIEADSIKGHNKKVLTDAINGLESGGSTAGFSGISEAYRLAEKNFIEGGNNRIILATDGDFNVGMTGNELIGFVDDKKENGIFMSVLGYGMDNLNDQQMELIAKHGNGYYAYIDMLEEAIKVLVDEFDSTMYVIAKDLKIQVEFNPATVKEYRLVGYDNRLLRDEDFNNDEKDAGDIGAGFAVTAFYEIVTASASDGESSPSNTNVDDLTYQTTEFTGSSDYMKVKVRYKKADGDVSQLVEKVANENDFTETPSISFRFASAVAEFGLLLSDSEYKANASAAAVVARAKANAGEDWFKNEFVTLAERYNDYIR